MILTVCIGSSCHLKGSREIVARLEERIKEQDLKDQVELIGSFCIGQCVKGVCVKLDQELFSLSPDMVDSFFQAEVLGRLRQ